MSDSFTVAERAHLTFKALDTDNNGFANELPIRAKDLAVTGRLSNAGGSPNRALSALEFTTFYQDVYESNDERVVSGLERAEVAREDVEAIRLRAAEAAEEMEQPEAPKSSNSSAALLTATLGSGGISSVAAVAIPLATVSAAVAISVAVAMAAMVLAVVLLTVYLLSRDGKIDAPPAPNEPDRSIAALAASDTLKRAVTETLRAQIEALDDEAVSANNLSASNAGTTRLGASDEEDEDVYDGPETPVLTGGPTRLVP